MKEWITIRTKKYKEQQRKCWHIWFAWYPVTVYEFPDGAKTKAWLRNVLRKGKRITGWEEDWWNYEYRLGFTKTNSERED